MYIEDMSESMTRDMSGWMSENVLDNIYGRETDKS